MAKLYHDAYVRLRSKPTGRWFVHPDLRKFLVADAAATDRTLTDVVAAILADRYGIDYAARKQRSRPAADEADVLKLRLPIEVWQALGMVRVASGRPENDVIRETLCAHYGLAMPGAQTAAA